MNIIEIDATSEAGKYLTEVFADKGTYKVRISESGDGVKVKRNEGTWTWVLKTEAK